MEIVIKIDNKRYKDILRISTVQLKGRTPTLEQIIANGTPLPEHHGRLIDADLLIRDTIKNPVHAPYIHIIDVEEASTIIEGSDEDGR